MDASNSSNRLAASSARSVRPEIDSAVEEAASLTSLSVEVRSSTCIESRATA